MCSSGSLSKAQPHINRGADARSAVMMGWVDDLRSKGQIPSAGGQYLRGMAQGIADQRGTTITSSSIDRQPGKLNDFMFKGGRARGSELNAQINATPKKESTPPLPKSSGDSGLSIRRSTSGSSSNTSNRRGGSRSGARKRYKTT